MTTPNAPHGYRPDIDGLRALAVLGVVVFHAFPAALPGGFIGVDVFFVISGYLIAGLIFRALERGQFSLGDFYRRRCLRIFPALLPVLIATLIYGRLALGPEDFARLGREVANGTFFVANYYFLGQAGYFDKAASSKPLLHLWSLGIEEQFYIFFPLSAWLLRRRRSVVLWSALALSFAFNLWLVSHDTTRAFYLPWSRFWELLVGALLADAELSGRARPRTWSAPALLVLCASGLSFNESLLFPGAWALIPTVATALVIAAGPNARANRLLGSRAGVFVGLISYPLYLWHWPILSVWSHFKYATMWDLTLAIGLAFALAILTQRYLEPRLRHPKHPTPTALVLFAVLLSVGALGIFVYQNHQAQIRADRKRFAPYGAPIDFDWGRLVRLDRCHLEDVAVKAHVASCVAPGSPMLLLWGDSQGAALYPGLEAIRGRRGLAQFTQAGCAPLFDLPRLTYRRDCNDLNRAVLERARELKPDVVLLAAAWFHESYPLDAAERRRLFLSSITTIKTALSNLKRVIVIGPPLRWTRPLRELTVEHMRAFNLAVLPERSNEALDGEFFAHDDAMADLAREAGVTYISLRHLLCADGGCLTRVGPAPTDLINVDDWHLSAAGARYVVRRLAGELGWGAEVD